MQVPQGQGRFQSWIEASSVVAAALYGLGWILTARFLGRFGVAPEEVGFSFSYLLIRVAFVVLVFLGVAGGIFWVLTRLAEHSGQIGITIPVASVPNAIRITAVGAVFLLVPLLGLLALAGFIAWRRIGVRDRMTAEATYGTPDAPQQPQEPHLKARTVLRVLAGAVVLAAAVGLLAVPLVAADSFANRIKRGDELKMSVLPGIPGLSALRVDVATVDGTALTPDLGPRACLHLLGSAGGTVVLYDHDTDTVLRLPQERLTLTHPCPTQ